MSSSERLEAITAQLGELDPRDVLLLQSRVARIAQCVRMDDPIFRRRRAAGIASACSDLSERRRHSGVTGECGS